MAKKKQKVAKNLVVKLVILLILVAASVVAMIFKEDIRIFLEGITSTSPIINKLLAWILPIIKTIQIAVISIAIVWIIRRVLLSAARKNNRALTVVRLINSIIKYAVAIVAVFLVLKAWGVDTSTLLASMGIIALVIGLGIQGLIGDIVAGVFIVFEGSYQVGDIVVIDGWRGTVEEIGVRTTRIVDVGGNVKIMNNSAISSVINQSKQLSVATATIGIEYGESIQRVELVIQENLNAIRERIPEIKEGPFYKGVSNLGESSVDLLFVAKCKEDDIYNVQRALNRELKIMFDDNNINIPFPQVTISKLETSEVKLSAQQEKKADSFTKAQSKKSKDIEI